MMIILHQLGIGNKFCVILLILGFGKLAGGIKLLGALAQKLAAIVGLVFIIIGKEIFQLLQDEIQFLLGFGSKEQHHLILTNS